MKIFKSLFGAALLIAATTACTSDDEKDADTGGTDDTDEVVTLDCEEGLTVTVDGSDYVVALDGLSILRATPNLSASGFQPFEATTCDWTFGDNLLNIYQTGVTDLANGWDEEKVIPSVSFTEATEDVPRLDNLELAIDHVDMISELTGDDKTLFNTEDEGGLTYALRIYDASGALADCIAWGDDVPGMFNGQVPSNNSDGHTNASEISAANCADLSR